MKKIYMILGAALLCLAGCNKTETTMAPQHLKLDLTIHNQMAPATKSVKTDWADGDKIYVFFGLPEEHPTPAYLTLTRSGSSWTETWTAGLEAEIAATTSGTLTAFFSPIDIDDIYYGSDKWYDFYGEHYCFALACNNVPYAVSAGVLSATMDLVLSNDTFVQFFLPGEADNVANLTFSSDHIMKSMGAGMIDETGKVGTGNSNYSYPIPGFAYDGGIIFSGLLRDSVSGEETAYTFTIVDSKGTADTADDVTYTLTKTATISWKDAILLPALSEWSVSVPKLVDLGLASGVKWASFNVGATKPEEYGKYFAWGETEPKSVYSWDNYFDTTDGGSTFTKYAADKKMVLDPEDDAAYVALGGSFRMPTKEDWEELYENCTWTWTTDYNSTGASGMIVTGPNANSIFLPPAGLRESTEEDVGFGGYYWASSLYTSKSAWVANTDANTLNLLADRFTGCSVRPVSD